MSDVKCPYCGEDNEINHDDGYGYEEDEAHNQECLNCEKEFEFTTSISFSYSVYCADEDDHDLKNSTSHPELFECTKCDYYKVLR